MEESLGKYFRVSDVEEAQEEVSGFKTVLGRVSSRVEIMLSMRAALSLAVVAFVCAAQLT